MTGISSWILSIAGIICLSVLIELILPDGQINKYIKSIFSFVIVLVVISPIPKLLNTNINYANLFQFENSFMLDEDYLYQLNFDKMNALQAVIEDEILENGYENVKVFINSNIFESSLKIKSVCVDLSDLVISQNAEHKDILKIKKHITTIIQKHTKIDGEMISYEN
ncbi:MAG: hypothetical protein E7379_01820 [Clostridiales bacterium]|nr:hypothetical protein [Clostridiales bacterium]